MSLAINTTTTNITTTTTNNSDELNSPRLSGLITQVQQPQSPTSQQHPSFFASGGAAEETDYTPSTILYQHKYARILRRIHRYAALIAAATTPTNTTNTTAANATTTTTNNNGAIVASAVVQEEASDPSIASTAPIHLASLSAEASFKKPHSANTTSTAIQPRRMSRLFAFLCSCVMPARSPTISTTPPATTATTTSHNTINDVPSSLNSSTTHVHSDNDSSTILKKPSTTAITTANTTTTNNQHATIPDIRYLLPTWTPHEDSTKISLVLDLDETLVHSSFKPVPNADFIVPVEIDNQIHNVYVLKRPFVDYFLRTLAPYYELSIFTASLSKYADPVIDHLDPTHTLITHRLFRQHCLLHRGSYIKDLGQLGRPLHKTIIVDNSPQSYMFHPWNAVGVQSWFDDPRDAELKVLVDVLVHMRKLFDLTLPSPPSLGSTQQHNRVHLKAMLDKVDVRRLLRMDLLEDEHDDDDTDSTSTSPFATSMDGGNTSGTAAGFQYGNGSQYIYLINQGSAPAASASSHSTSASGTTVALGLAQNSQAVAVMSNDE